MKKFNLTFICVAILLSSVSFAFSNEFNFDGKNKAANTFLTQISSTTAQYNNIGSLATQQENPSSLSLNTDNIPSFEMGIVTESGEKIKITPTIDPITKKNYYKFKPSQNIYWRANCTSVLTT